MVVGVISRLEMGGQNNSVQSRYTPKSDQKQEDTMTNNCKTGLVVKGAIIKMKRILDRTTVDFAFTDCPV